MTRRIKELLQQTMRQSKFSNLASWSSGIAFVSGAEGLRFKSRAGLNRTQCWQRGLCPEEINRVGASGAQIEFQISVFGGLTPDLVTFLG